MSGFVLRTVFEKTKVIGVVLILIMLCTGVASAERVGQQKEAIAQDFVIQLNPLSTVYMTDADSLAQSLVGSGVTISDAQFTGAGNCAGTFAGGDGIIGITQGVIISSGDIANVIGPNTLDDITADFNQPGDPELDALIPGFPTHDACILEFDFVPAAGIIQFNYVFTSDEYNEYVDSEYNDVFGFFVDGQNIALIPGTTIPVAINNVNNGNPFGVGTPSHPEFYVNNDLDDGGPFLDTEMDGLTTVFAATAQMTPNVKHHMKLAIADAGDELYDSNVFIEGSSLVSGSSLVPTSATNTVGQTHILTATFIFDTGEPLSGQEVTFTITAGPNAGLTGTAVTNEFGVATWSYSSSSPGTDTIIATWDEPVDQPDQVSQTHLETNNAFKTWVAGSNIPEFPSVVLPATFIIGLLGAVFLIKRTKEQ